MKNRFKNWIAIALLPQILLIKWIGSYPEFVDTYYSQGFYPLISQFFRSLLGWSYISFGDIIYCLLFILSVRYVVLNWKKIRKKPKAFFRDFIMVLSVVYFTFHLAWGLNYYRVPLAKSLELKETYSFSELEEVTKSLIKKTNQLQFEISKDSTEKINIPYTRKEFFELTIDGYQKLEQKLPQFAYNKPSIKNSLLSTMLSYMGYGGYLNPFTNEAQVNAKVPSFRFPIIAGHEIGHQIGYSAENEVNFIGYLVTSNNDNIYFKYAAYAYAASYCLSEIKRRDKTKAATLYATFNLGVKKNFDAYYAFWKAYDNPLEPVFKNVFNTFLKANNQKDGIKSYYKIVTYLVAYHLKYPIEFKN